jgi:hypothetical protein
MNDALVLPIQPLPLLWNGFQLVTQFSSVLEDQFIEDGSICIQYNEDDHFVGQRRDRPAPSF